MYIIKNIFQIMKGKDQQRKEAMEIHSKVGIGSYIYKCIFKYYLYNCLKLTGDVLSQKITDS